MNIKLKDNDLTTLPGIGNATELKFKSLGIERISDLILFLPSNLVDKTFVNDPNKIKDKQQSIFIGKITKVFLTKSSKKSLIIKLDVDGSEIQLRFIHKVFIYSNLKLHMNIRVTGTVYKKNNIINMIHPETEIISNENDLENIIPHYNTKGRISQNKIRKTIKFILDYIVQKNTNDVFDDKQLEQYGLANYIDALRYCHLPSSNQTYETCRELFQTGRRRFIFEELLSHRLKVNSEIDILENQKGCAFNFDSSDFNNFINNLNFKLTPSQDEVIKIIENDFRRGKPSKRLIQGDVGCGKTVVAAAACYMSYLSGYQSSILVPTEILAHQHLSSFLKFFDKTTIKIRVITSRLCPEDKKQIFAELKEGDIDIIIGTHALLSENIVMHKLGLCIIDEQHKFGVEQRSTLSKSSAEIANPHQILLSATPIPRSLSLVLYEGLSYSKIIDMPKGRKNVKTTLISRSQRETIINKVRKIIELGQQVFWLCPSIDNNLAGLSDIYSIHEELSSIFAPEKIATLHGQANKEDNETNLKKFQNKTADLLICTTMIEVGVNITNASMIVVEDAHRFGLSQLHQLRGRVGRGNHQGYCLLIYDEQYSDSTIRRLESLASSSDGFSIAESDLKLRGSGDYFGIRQSGQSNQFKLANYEEVLDNFDEIKNINNLCSQLTEQQKKILLSRWVANYH